MDYLKTNPKGIDIPIQQMQVFLNKKLEFDKSYGRVYKIDVGFNRFIPAHFIEKTSDYVEVLTDDSLNGSFFFIENNRTLVGNDSMQITTPIDIIFQMNLRKLQPDMDHMADEEMRLEILGLVSLFPKFEITEVIKGIEALKGFYHNLRDMQPYTYLKVSGNVKYQNVKCKTIKNGKIK